MRWSMKRRRRVKRDNGVMLTADKRRKTQMKIVIKLLSHQVIRVFTALLYCSIGKHCALRVVALIT